MSGKYSGAKSLEEIIAISRNKPGYNLITMAKPDTPAFFRENQRLLKFNAELTTENQRLRNLLRDNGIDYGSS